MPLAVAIWGAIGAVAGAAGPTLGAVVVEHLGWRWAFFINLPVGIVSLVLGSRVLPEGKPEHPGPLADMVGVVLLAAGLVTTAFAIVKTAEWGMGTQFVATLAVGVVLVGLFVWRCAAVRNSAPRPAPVPEPQLPLGQHRDGRVHDRVQRHVPGQRVVPDPGVGVLDPHGRAGDLGRTDHRGGHRALPGQAGRTRRATGAPGSRWDRVGVGGLWLLRTVGTQPDYAAEYLPSMALTGLGVSLCLPQLSSAAVQGLPSDQFGSGSAVNQAVRNLGATLGVALVVAFTADATSLTALVRSARCGGCWCCAASARRCSPPSSGPRPADRPTEPVAAEDPAGIAEPLAVRALGADLQP